MKHTSGRNHETLFSGIIAFMIPFVFLFQYVIPSELLARTIDNDFSILYYRYKLYLLSALSQFHFPLWSPAEAAGFPFYANPFTQSFYPLNLCLIIYYKLTGGYSYLDHQIFTVFGMALFALGIFGWLRSLQIANRHALFATAIVSVSIKLTEIVRFPNAVHTIAWLPFLLWGCTLALRPQTAKKGGGMIFLGTVMMLTGGYLYYVYYSAFILGPYILLLLFPQTRQVIAGSLTERIKPFLVTIFISFSTAGLLCFPYLLKTLQLLAQTVDRGGNNFQYSTAHEFTFTDTIGSLFFPPAAQMEGWYYFGMVGVLLILFYIVLILRRETGSQADGKLLIVILVWTAVISYITYGKYSYLFSLLWYYLPGFSSLRVWGRMNIILLPLIALLLARAYASFERFLLEVQSDHESQRRLTGVLVGWSLCYVSILAVQFYLYSNKVFDAYWTTYFQGPAPGKLNEGVFLLAGLIAFVVILIGVSLSRKKKAVLLSSKASYWLVAWATILWFFNSFDVYLVGTQQWSFRVLPPTDKSSLNLEKINSQALSTPRIYPYDTISLSDEFSVGIVENWYFNRYIGFLKAHAGSRDFKQMMGVVDGQRFYFSSTIDHPDPTDFLADAAAHSAASQFRITVERYTGDELNVVVEATQPGYFSFIDNWDADWTALVDGQAVEIQKLFGTFKTVNVAAGHHTIAFVYQPFRWLARR